MREHTNSMRALHELDWDSIDETPQAVAKAAKHRQGLVTRSQRANILRAITNTSSLGQTRTGKKLSQIIDNSERAVRMLQTIGYMPLRHLRASGLTLSTIADDLGINVNDLTEFMASHPSALQDAELDAEAYADRKASELLCEMEDMDNPRRDEIELLKVRSAFLLEVNKRYSHKWAQRAPEVADRLPSLVINIGQDAKDKNQPRVVTPEEMEKRQAKRTNVIEQSPDNPFEENNAAVHQPASKNPDIDPETAGGVNNGVTWLVDVDKMSRKDPTRR